MKRISNFLKVIILIYYFFMLSYEILVYLLKLIIEGIEPITYMPLQILMSVAILICFIRNNSLRKVYIRSIIVYGILMNLNLNIYRASSEEGGVILFAVIPVFLIYIATLLDYILYKKSNNK